MVSDTGKATDCSSADATRIVPSYLPSLSPAVSKSTAKPPSPVPASLATLAQGTLLVAFHCSPRPATLTLTRPGGAAPRCTLALRGVLGVAPSTFVAGGITVNAYGSWTGEP